MKRFKQHLLIAAALTMSGIAGSLMTARQAVAQNPNPPSAPVRIVSPLPLPVRDVDDAIRTPFQEFLRSDVVGANSFTVEPTHRLTIEFVSSDCQIQQATPRTNNPTDFVLQTTIASQTINHYFHPKFSGLFEFPGGNLFNSSYGSTDMTRIYADPGTTVRLTGITRDFSCFVSVSGYTVPA